MSPSQTAAPASEGRPAEYLAVALVAGAIITLQICIMRIFAVGSWAHFGSMVVSMATLGFGCSSVLIYLAKRWMESRWRLVAGAALAAFGPLVVGANLVAQALPFNAIFLVSDPAQKWRLLASFVLYFVPFLSGALFLGAVFLVRQRIFGRIYFADLTGSGLSGLLVLGAMYVLSPEQLLLVPVGLWATSLMVWSSGLGQRWLTVGLAALAVATIAGLLLLPGLLHVPPIAISQYKGVSYARNYPDARRVYRSVSPFGDLQVYASSYMHFAPGLSDNAAFNLPEVPADAYLGMFIDSDGPDGIMRDLPASQTGYFHYLPMFYPYVIKSAPDTFVVQFGGGISTRVALDSGSRSVTVAESNPAVLEAFGDAQLRSFTGDVLHDPRVHVVPYEGRLYLAASGAQFDLVDLSLADSTGLSNPGGFAIVEKYPYTREALTTYMRALRPGGVLSVTLWNKEEPPKAALRFYATIVEAARALDGKPENSFFVASMYLSTTTVLYKRGGFSAAEVASLRQQTTRLSFDEIYSPGFAFDASGAAKVLDDYRTQTYANPPAPPADGKGGDVGAEGDANGSGAGDAAAPPSDAPPDDAGVLPATTLARLSWNALIHGGWDDVARNYVFDVHPLTNDRPYFAGYVKIGDFPKAVGQLDTLQDDWGYLLIWATLAVACITAALLIGVPMLAGWRVLFRRPGAAIGAIVYFACLGFGYIMVEVGLISRFIVVLGNATISAAILITVMLVASGLGSLASERILRRARTLLPGILVAVGIVLVACSLWLDPLLDWIGVYPYFVRLTFCFLLVAPVAFLMGFPMATAMTSLARLGRGELFVWAWGINGCASVVGAAAVPVIATTLGLGAVLQASGAVYILAIPAFLAVIRNGTPGQTAPPSA